MTAMYTARPEIQLLNRILAPGATRRHKQTWHHLQVKDKRRSPPSTRSPSAPQRNPHHSGTVEEQESPERVVQKEKLHAELKQVLSQKRSNLRESTCRLAQPEMDSEPAEEQTCTEEVSKSVEVVVETEAEAGASGYSVTGGGQHGIFVKDVLKDSPAAKHLSLQQGDQLLSAKVYFDNVRYEDALKILQCAEPYKVSFQVKRTVPKAEVSVRPKVPSGEVKGPKAKLAKMSVKGMKSFKTQKKRGGRFGLKRLKEKRREELVIEGTPPRLEAGDVDVEFSLPKLKHRKSATSDVEVRGTGNVGKTKSHIRFPHMKTKEYSAAAGQLEFQGHENVPPTEIPGAKVKTKGKGHKFGIVFPKTKQAKSDSGSLDVRPPEISLQPPSVEVSLSGKEDKNVVKRGSKFNPPDVEFALPSGKVEASLPTVKGTTEIKAPKVDVRGAADVPQGKVNVDVGKEDAKLRLPKLKLPKIRLSRHSDEIDGDIKVKAKGTEMPHADINSPTAEIRGGGEIRLPEVEVTKPNIKGDISGKAASVQMPSVDISLTKIKGKSDASYSLQGLEGAGKSEINMPAINISVPDAVLPSDSGRRIPDEVEGSFKGPKISVPRVDISLPKTGAPGVDIEGLGGGGKFNPPSVGISSPKIKSDGVDVHMDHYVGGDGKFKLPDFDVTLPKMKLPEEEVEVGFKLPKMDLTLPKSNVVATDNEGKGTFQLPSVDVSLPKLKAGQVEVDAEGQTVKGGKFEMSVKPLPKGKMEGDIDVKGCVEGDKFKTPSIDVSLPKLGPEGHIKAPKLEVESDIPVPSVNISMAKGKADGDVEIGDLEAKGGKFKVPLVNIKLPKMESAGAEADIQGPEIKGQKIKAPSAPKGELDIEGRVKGGKFSMPSVKISLPKTKLPEGDVKLEAPELPNINLSVPTSSKEANMELEGNGGAKFKMPNFDITFPKGQTQVKGGDIKEPTVKEGAKFNMPSLDISLPTIKSPEKGTDISFEGPEMNIKSPKANLELKGTEIKEGKLNLPTKDVSLPKEKADVKINVEGKGGKLKMPSFDMSLPKVKMPEENIEIEGQPVDISLPKGKLDVDIGTKSKGGHFHLPSVDVSLPKIKSKRGNINIEGPELKSGEVKAPTIDISPPQGTIKGDIDIDDEEKGVGFDVPSVDIVLSSVKIPDRDVNLQGPKVKGDKFEMPRIDLSLPKGKKHGNINIDIHSGIDGNIEISSLDTKLPKGQGKSGINVKGPGGKVGKHKKPKFNVSVPKLDAPEVDVKVHGPEVKGKIEMPAVDISPPKGRLEGDLDIDSHGAKGDKFHMPSLNINLPKIKSKEASVDVKGHEGQGQTFGMPSMDISAPKIKSPEVDVSLEGPDVDISLPNPKADVEMNVKNPEIEGGKTKMPTFDISMPKVNFPESEVKLKGPDFKGKKIEMPDIDISLPKGISDGEIDGHGWKGGKFHIPSVDFSLPKIKAKGPEVNIEGPELKQGDINMPDVDISLQNRKVDVDFNVESTEIKGGKFKMPKFDISLPKTNLTGGHVDAPKVNISVDRCMDKEGKFQLPSVDVSLPKIEAKGADIHIKGPELKSDIAQPKGKVEGDLSFEGPHVKGQTLNLPTGDMSFSKGTTDADFDVDGKFKMPKFDLSLPKVSLPEGETKDLSIKGGRIEMPDIDISIPKGKGEIETRGHSSKGSKFQMPSVDISLPKIKGKGPDLRVEIPEVQGGKGNMPFLDVSVPNLKSPELNVSLEGPDMNVDVLPQSLKAEGDVNAEGMEGGKFKMPKFDIRLPKISLPKVDSNVEGPGIKGKAKINVGDVSVPKPKGPEINVGGPKTKGGKIQMPAVDISLPKGKTDGDLDVEVPEMKDGKFTLPKFDISLPKVTLQKTDVGAEGPEIKGEMEVPAADISLPKVKTDVEIDVGSGKSSTFHMPSVDIAFPTIKGKGADVDIHGPNIKGDLSLPKIKSSHIETTIKGPEIEGGKVDLQNMDVSLPKGKVEANVNAEGTEVKGGKFKMPKFDVSLPKINLPKVEVNVEGPDMKGKIEKPTTDISPPKGMTTLDINAETGKGSKFHMPTVDFSLPNVKAKGAQIGIQRPDIKGDLSLPKVKGPAIDISLRGPEVEGGKVDQPNLDISYPKGKLEGGAEVEGNEVKGGKFKMPKTDLSLPMGSLPEAELKVKGPEFKTGKIELPDIDFSLPKGKVEGHIATEGHAGKGGRFRMSNIDISLPKLKAKGTDINIEGPELKGEKIKAEGPAVNVEGPEIKGGKLKMPDVDISLAKGKVDGDFNVEAPKMKGGKFKLPKFDVSLPKVSLPKTDADIEGPEVKGKVEIPAPEVSLPKVKTDVEIDVNTGTSSKFHMPSIDINLPKIKAEGPEVNVEGPEIKGGRIKMPDFDVSLAKGKVDGDFNVKGPEMKGGKFKLPKFDVSLPKVSLPKADASIEGPEVKEKVEIPAPEVSLPKANKDVEIDVNTGTSGKFHMPSIDINLPKIKAEGPEVNVEGPEIKGGRIKMPDVDVSLPKGNVDGDFNVKGPEMKGGKFKLPKFDVSLPKVSLPKADASIEGPEVKGKVEIPAPEVSLPKVKTDVEIDVNTGTKGKFHMPSIDINLPKIKAEGPEVNVEGPEIKGGRIKMPDVDVSLPKGNVDGDFNVKGPEIKGGKFKLPKFDVSLPKVSLPKTDASIEGPDMKGKVEIPAPEVSLPKVKTDVEIDVNTGTSSKFHMPSIDINLPKIKAEGPEVNVEGPEIKGGRIKMPDVDVSLPKGNVDGDFNVKGPEMKGGKFKLPKFDVSLPKVSLPKTDAGIEGPDMKGKVEIPAPEVSLPKANKDVEIDVNTGTSSKFHMPSVDIDFEGEKGNFKMPKIDVSLPKVSLPEGNVKVKGPDIKAGNIELPDIDLSLPKPNVEGEIDIKGQIKKGGKFHMPSIHFPDMKAKELQANIKSTEADVDIKGPHVKGGKGGKFHMPTLDVNMPRFDLDLSLPSVSKDKGLKVEVSGPDASGDLEMLGLKGDIKPDQLKVKTGDLEGPGASLKLPSVKLPTVDISAPKLDLDFGHNKPQSDDVELLKAEGGRPSSGGSFDLPNVSLKAASFTFPRFGSKSKSGDLEASGLQADISVHPPNVEGEIRAPSVEFDGDGKVKMKKPKIKMPSFGISKKDTDVSVSCPDVDIKMKKGKPDFPHLDFTTDNPDNKAKHKIKFPKFKMSSPKVHLPEGEVDAKVEADMDRKGGFHAPDVTLKFPKFSIPGFGSKEKDLSKPSGELQLQPKVKVPSVELSLPEAKTPEMEVLLPKAEVDVSEADIKGYEGNLKIPKKPKIDVSIPQVDLDVSLPKGKCQKIGRPDMELEGGEGKFKMPQITMPTVDVTLPKGKPKDLTKPKTEIDADGGKFTIPYVKMPTVDITLPKPDISLSKAEAPEIKIEGTTEQKFKMPRVDISLPTGKFQDNETPEMNERGKIKMPHIKMPSVDVTLPKGQIEGPDVEIRGKGGKLKMPQVSMPSVDISCSKGKAEGPNVQVEGNSGDRLKLPHCKMPDVDVSLPKGQTEAPDVEIKGEKGTYKMPQISMPSIQISLPKGKAEDLDIEVNKGERFKAPYIKMPSVDASIPKVKTSDPDAGITGNVGGKFKMPHVKVPNVEFAVLKGKENPDVEIKGEGGKFKMPHISMPSGDGSLAKVQFESPEIETGGGTEGKVNMPHLKMPSVDISLAKGNAGKIEGTAFKGEVHIPEVPSGDISLQKGKTAGPIPGIKSEGGKFKMPKVDITLPRGKPSVETPEVDIKKEGLLEMAKASTDKPIKGPKEDIDVDIGFQREEGMMNKKKVVLPDLDLNTSGTETKVKRGKVKGKKFKIGVPKMKGAEDVTAEAKQCGDNNVKHNDHSTGKGHMNVTAPEVTLPSICLKTGAGSKGGQSPSSYEIKVPRIPDIEFDIGTSQDEDDDKTETEKKVKIPKFGVPLPSMSSPERRMDIYGSEVQYEGPKMPKVKKAVFVLVNPNETEQVAANTAFQKKETTAENETEDVKVKMAKVNTKSSFGKSKDKMTEGEVEEEEKSKGAKIKMPKFSLSSGKSVDVTVKGDGSSSSLNGEKDATPHKDSKDDKGTFGGKIKLPKVEFTRPYSKMATGDKMGKDSSSGEVKGDVQGLETPDKMASTEVVSSQARTEMLDRDSSESPAGFSTDFTSTKVHMWSEGGSRGNEAEEKESTSWFKVPKFTLKPHATGFLQITPEGSPQAQRRGELGGEAEVSGSFCLHTSGVDFASQQMSEEHQVSSTEEGSVTTVTKTTRITSHLVTTETRASGSSSTTHQVLDFNY